MSDGTATSSTRTKPRCWASSPCRLYNTGSSGLVTERHSRYTSRDHTRVSGPPATNLKFTGLAKVANADPRGDFLLFEAKRASRDYRGGLVCQHLSLNGIRGLFASQPSHFSIQSCDNRGQPLYPFCGPFTGGESHLLCILVPVEAFSQRPVEALLDALVPEDVNPTAPNLDRVLCQQLTDRAHEFTAGVNLKKILPPQGAPLVNPSNAIGDLCRRLASQGLSLLETDGNVNDRENVKDSFPSYTIVWQEEQVGLIDLVWHRHVKLRPWYVTWGREVDLPAGLLFEAVLCLLLSHICCD